jgi:hypothetical protein
LAGNNTGASLVYPLLPFCIGGKVPAIKNGSFNEGRFFKAAKGG